MVAHFLRIHIRTLQMKEKILHSTQIFGHMLESRILRKPKHTKEKQTQVLHS